MLFGFLMYPLPPLLMIDNHAFDVDGLRTEASMQIVRDRTDRGLCGWCGFEQCECEMIRTGKKPAHPLMRVPIEEEKDEAVEAVDHPLHYRVGGIEHIDVVEALQWPYAIACATKYLWRYKYKKSPLEDLRKAQWFLARYIAYAEQHPEELLPPQ